MSVANRIEKIQDALADLEVDAWLFFDFRHSDPIGSRILGLDPQDHATRRWFYLVPRDRVPCKLVHRIESGKLDDLPGRKEVYLRWQELQSRLAEMLKDLSRVAMQYSPENAIPYAAVVDAGTVELVRKMGVEVISSADLLQLFDALVDEEQLRSHREAAVLITRIVGEAFRETARRIRDAGKTSEFDIQQFILRRFDEEKLLTDFPPIVAVNQNSGDPHYAPDQTRSTYIRKDDFLLIDLWARTTDSRSVFADITWCGVFAQEPSQEQEQIFDIVRRARDRGVELLQERFQENRAVQGHEVDDAVRNVIESAGYGQWFIHRTGHSLGSDAVHGNGVHFDNLETHDLRSVLPGLLCTIEPGIYRADFGVRSEINVYISSEGPIVTTPPQSELMRVPVQGDL